MSSILAAGAILIGLPYYLSEQDKKCDRILMIRSGQPDFLPDRGVVPDEDEDKRNGIKVIHTPWHHTNMTDLGPKEAKDQIVNEINKFLDCD